MSFVLRWSPRVWWSVALLGAGGFAQAAGCGGVDTGDLFGVGGASTSSNGVGGDTASSGSRSVSSGSGAGGSGSSVSGTGGAGVTSSASVSGSASATSSVTSSASTGGVGCGNGKIDPGEKCDGSALGGTNCTAFGFVTGAGLACLPDCSDFDTSGCKPVCGNGVLEPGEACDGNDLGTQSCSDLGFKNPNGLRCTNTCTVDSSNCKAVCGNSAVEPSEQCDDGNKLAGDGCSPTCQFEVLTGGTTCATAIAIDVPLGTKTLSGTTAGGGAHTPSSCQGGDGPDRIYALKPAQSGYLTAYLPRSAANFDSVLYAANACNDVFMNDFLCNDSFDEVNNQGLDGGEVVSFHVNAGSTYFVVVDTFDANTSGNYNLMIDLSTGNTCADPVPIPLEPGSAMTVLGTTTGVALAAQGSCGGGPGGEVVYRVQRVGAGPIGADTDPNSTNFNTVLYARSDCASPNTELQCSNQAGTAAESIALTSAPQPVFVYVDGSTAGGGSASGNFGLILTP